MRQQFVVLVEMLFAFERNLTRINQCRTLYLIILFNINIDSILTQPHSFRTSTWLTFVAELQYIHVLFYTVKKTHNLNVLGLRI